MLHVLVGQEEYFQPVSEARPDDRFRWALPKAARVGDSALIYFPSTGAITALAEVLSSPVPGTFGNAAVYMADVGNIKRLSPPLTIQALRIAFKDWGWPTYPRTYTAVKGELEAELLRLMHLDPAEPADALARPLNTYLLTWNPARASWDSLLRDATRSQLGELVEMRWSSGNTKRIVPGDRLFLMRVGVEPRGIVASGWAREAPAYGLHWEAARADDGDKTLYVTVEFERILDCDQSLPLSLDYLKEQLPPFNWTPQSSGLQILPTVALHLEKAWMEHVERVPVEASEDISALEGQPEIRYVRHRRRERYIRDAKIAEVLASGKRLTCEVPGCGFDFEARYGTGARGLAIVHHLEPLASLNGPRLTRLSDVVIVCANCHTFIHHGGRCRELSELAPANSLPTFRAVTAGASATE
jgi:5-methylcytosine-specific restriction enzyme A